MANTQKNEKSILEILHIIYKRKLIVVFSILILLFIALLYNQITTPVYESTALLKKEMADKKQTSNDFYEIVQMQTLDEVETEVELVKTGEVIGAVVNDLKLFINPYKVVKPDGSSLELNQILIAYPDSENDYSRILGFGLPKFSNLRLNDFEYKMDFYVVKKGENLFELRETDNNEILLTSRLVSNNKNNSQVDSLIGYQTKNTVAKFSNDSFEFDFSWQYAPLGTKFYFNLQSFYSTVDALTKKVSVSKIGKTNVFEISVKSSSPFVSKTIAECLIDKFREARIEQQKQTIKYSFKFVDEQLQEVKEKLLESEDNLSRFKASGQIISIDESSQELVGYLSSLEAEKLNTDLQLSDYKNKAEELKKQLKTSGYFDQSYLDPQGKNDVNSPFANLLKQVSDLELQKLELQQKRSENHPDVKAIDEQIKAAKEKLAGYNQNTLASYQILISTLEKKLDKISNLTSRYEVKMQKLPSQESQLVRLIRQKDVYEKIFTLLLDKREEMRMAEVSKLQDIIVVDPPQKSVLPISPNKRLNLLIAFILGGFIGLLGIFIVELKNSRLIDIDSLEEFVQLPVLSIIPKFGKDTLKRLKNPYENSDKFVTLMDTEPGIKESLRLLKTKLLIQLDNNEKIILITSCEENTGKTTIVSNLAVSFAQEEKKVLVIDCDLRKAELTRTFNIPVDSPGLIDYLTNDSQLQIYNKVMKKIDVVPAGGLTEDSAEILNSAKMLELLNNLEKSDYDYILVDTPPVNWVVDTLVLGRFIKSAVLVVRPLVSFKDSVTTGIKEMRLARIKIRGVIANAAEIEKSYTYKYKYGYGYGYSSKGNSKSSNGFKGKILKITDKSRIKSAS